MNHTQNDTKFERFEFGQALRNREVKPQIVQNENSKFYYLIQKMAKSKNILHCHYERQRRGVLKSERG